MTTDKTIKSKYQPKQTNVTWVDLSGETPVEKHFINGKWAEISGGGKGSQQDPGYTVTKSYVTLDEETLTTNPGEGFIVGFQNDFQLIYGDTYIVTYNGVKYKCVADKDYECIWIGGHNGDFSEYPFRIAYFFNEEYTLLFAETQGTYTVKIEHLEELVETTHDFESAVKDVLLTNKKNLLIYPDTIDSESSTVTAVYNKEFVTGNTYIVPFEDSSGIRFLPFYLESIEYHYPEGEPSINSPIMTSIMTDRIGSWIRDDNGTIAFIPEGNGLSDGYIIRIESYDGINWRCYLVYQHGERS